MNLKIIEICPLNKKLAPQISRPSNNETFFYKAIAIEDGGKFFYWAKGVSIEIQKNEYEYVTCNPKLYYFSTALKLHKKIENLLNKQSKTT